MSQNGQVQTNTAGMKEPLKQPEVAADLTVAEASEIKERKRLIDKQIDEVNDANKVLALLRIENQRFLQTLIANKNLPSGDDYNLDSEGGVILRTARAVALDPEPVDDAPDVGPEPDTSKSKGKKALAVVAEG